MAIYRSGVTLIFTVILLHHVNCHDNIETIASSLPRIGSLLENVTNALHSVVDLLERRSLDKETTIQNQILTTIAALVEQQTERCFVQCPASMIPTTVMAATTASTPIGQDCSAVLDQGYTENYGIYRIQPSGNSESFDVICDLESNGEGWIVFQRRFDGSEDFYRPWENYKNGFGDLAGEHWLGLEKLNLLTKSGTWQLRVDLEDFYGNTSYAEYSNFAIGDESTNYTLSFGDYSGTAGDSLLDYHNGMQFSTYDQDHDLCVSRHCAQLSQGAWWFKCCGFSSLNGLYSTGPPRDDVNGTHGMAWHQWKKRWEVLKKSEMKIRPTRLHENTQHPNKQLEETPVV